MLRELFEGIVVDFIKEHINKLWLLIPPSITVYIQKNYWLGLLVLVSILAVYFFWKVKGYRLSGISGVYKDKPKYLSTIQALKKTKSSFYFLGVSAKSTADDPLLEEQFSRLAKLNGYEIKFLIMNPLATENIKSRARDENADADSWILDMKSSILRLQKIATKNGLRIQIRLYDDYPFWRMLIIDKSHVYLNYALRSRKINASPLLEMTNNCDAICNTFIQIFESLWSKSSTVSIEDWLKSNSLN